MKRTMISLAMVIAMLGAVLVNAAPAKQYQDIKTPKLNELQVPEPVKVDLPNGIKLYLLEDHELPLINLTARVRVGSVFEPADKIGLASITGTVMRTGGTTTRSGDDLDDLLEGLAASVETSIGETQGFASVSVLKEDIDTGLEILADVLMNPAFPQDKIDLAVSDQKSAIARRNDDPGAIASREFAKVIYGADSPYARTTEYATIESITRDDLVAFHAKYFHPNNTMMAVWGDFDAQAMAKKVEQAMAGWKKKEPLGLPDIPEVNYEWKTSVNLVNRDDATQSQIRIGHIGIRQDHPDYFASIVMNRILGRGSMTTRLFKEVRSRLGLAYSVGGGVYANIDYPSYFYITCSTKSETTVQAINAIIGEIERMINEDVTEEELEQAKEAYLNAFVFNFDSTSEVVNRLMAYDFYGYPSDYLQRTKSSVEAVTVADVRRVAGNLMNPDALQIVVLGNPADFDEPLSVYGDVAELDITIPEPGGEELGEASADDMAKGQEVLAKMVNACGGADAAKGVKSVVIATDMSVNMQGQQMAIAANITMVYPDKMAVKMNLPFGEMQQIYNGQDGWAVSPMGNQDMGASDLEQTKAGLFRDLVNIMAAADALEARHLGTEDVDGATADVIMVSGGGQSVKLFVGADGMLLKQSYRGQTMMGPADMEEVYSDWREVGGLMMPYSTVTFADGAEFLSGTVSDIQVNGAVDESVFVKPEAPGE